MSRINRLAKILLDEIKIRKQLNENVSKDPLADAIIRQIGNLLILEDGHSGRAGPSWQKEANKRLSKEAMKVLELSKNVKDFHKKTHNEHQLPVADTHKWIVENCESISSQDIIDKISSFPMTTITWEEEAKLPTLGDPEKRYSDAGIEIVMLDKTPKEYFK
tara:strand:+ start:41 stop:526 length:486 start_codon:yes stop_codon:yes gene_type:complete